MNPLRKHWIVVCSAGCLALSAALAVAQSPAPPKVAAPASIADLLAADVKLFDAANASDWTAASSASTALKAVVAKVKKDIPKPNSAQQTRLKEIAAHLTAIDKAIKAKKRQPAILDANRLIRVSGILADTFINKVPQSIWQMEYLAREMQVSSADPADLTKLKALPDRLDAEWAKVSREVTTKAGDAVVKEYVDEMAKAKAAATPEEFSKLTQPMLDTLDKMEKSYLK